MALLQDLDGMSVDDFLTSIYGASAPARKPKRKAGSAKDSPAARIIKVLRQDRGFSDLEAQHRLSRALFHDGIDPAFIPQVSDDNLEVWVERLLKQVSSSAAYQLAQTA